MDNKPAALPVGSTNDTENIRSNASGFPFPTHQPQPEEEQQTDQVGDNGRAVAGIQQQQMLLALQQQMQPYQGRAAEDFGFGGAAADLSGVFQGSQAQQLLQQPIGPISVSHDAVAYQQQPARDQQAPLNQVVVAAATQGSFTAQVSSSSESSHDCVKEYSLAMKNSQLLNNEANVSSAPQEHQGQEAQPVVTASTKNNVFAVSSSTTASVGETADPSSAFNPRPLDPSAVRISAPQSFQQQLTSFNPSLLTQALSNFEVHLQQVQQQQLQQQQLQVQVRQHQLQQQQEQLQPQQQHPQNVQAEQEGPTNQEVAPKKQKRIYRHESFPEKLHRMLLELEVQGKDDIVSFIGEGNAFQIHQPTAFEEQIIPIYFRHSKLASFKRQLSMYGFQRITGGTEHGSYTHAMFLKNRPDLCKQMDRVS